MARASYVAGRLGVRAFALCLGLGVLGQVLSGMLSRSAPPIGERLLGVLLSASLLGSVVFVLGTFGLALGPAGAPRTRTFALLMASSTVTLVLSLHLLSAVLTVLLGSRPTSSGIAFFLNSTPHLGKAITKQYLGHAAAVMTGAAFVFALSFGVLSRALRDGRASRWDARGCIAMAALVAAALVVPGSSAAFARSGALRAAPELILFDSWEIGRDRSLESAPDVLLALDSPALADRATWTEVARSTPTRPSVVIVMLESVATSHVSHLGYARETTPELDRIAERSLVMRRAYTTATHSNYAQMAVISSLFPRRGHSLDMYQRIDYPRALQHDVLVGLGHRAASISSQDETWQGMLRFQTTDTPAYHHHALSHDGEKLDMVTEHITPDDATVDHAIAWLAKQPSSLPVSLYVNLQSTHFPYPLPARAPRPFLPDEPRGTFNYVTWDAADRELIANRYDNALAFVDAQVGRLYDALDASGRLDDTIFVVTADHGELFFEHGLVTHGRSLHEGEVRVPLLVHYPTVLEPGEEWSPVSTLDVIPTILDLMGHAPHPVHQGQSFARLREEGSSGRQAIFFNIQGWKHAQVIICGKDKLIYDPDTGSAQLFDVVEDPGETLDRAPHAPDRTRALLAALRAQMTAQDVYHEQSRRGQALRRDRAAPRLLPCPPDPGK